MSGSKSRAILIAPPFPRLSPVSGITTESLNTFVTQFNQAMAQIERALGAPTVDADMVSFGSANFLGAVAAGRYPLVAAVPVRATVGYLAASVGTAGGSFNVTVRVNGTPVTGLINVPVMHAGQDIDFASGDNTAIVPQYGAIDIIISSISGAPVGAALAVNGTMLT